MNASGVAPPPATVFPDPDSLGTALAAEIADGIRSAARSGRRYVLGCPGGRSLRSTYRALAAEVAARSLDLSGVVIAMMDEYVLPNGDRFVPVPATAHHSCRRFGEVEIAGVLNAAARESGRIPPAHVWLPDPADPAAYDRRLAQAGGIDLFLLASGASDGHVAFNPPGTDPDAPSRIVELARATRRDNLRTFPGFTGLPDVPRHGVTVGTGTIAAHSRRAVMVVHGAEKATAAARIGAAADYDPDWPATVLARCRQPALYLDAAAAAAAREPQHRAQTPEEGEVVQP